MKKLVYYIGIIICTGIFWSSCIGDDLSNCPKGIVPQFILVPYEGNNIINDSLYTAKVYVYDEQDKFVATYDIPGKPQLNKTYTADWGLPPGTYNFIVWLNHHDMKSDEHVKGQSTRQQTKLSLTVPDTKIIDKPGQIPFLCYGHLNNEKLDSATNLFSIPVMQLTNKINLRITGLNNVSLRSSSADSQEYEFSINDNNGVYGYDGEFAEQEPFTYSTSKQIQSDTLDASLTVLKLSGTKTTPTFTIKNRTTGTQIYPVDNQSNNLVQHILSNYPNNNFDKTHSYNINIDIASDMDITVTITIIDWENDPYNPDLDINK